MFTENGKKCQFLEIIYVLVGKHQINDMKKGLLDEWIFVKVAKNFLAHY